MATNELLIKRSTLVGITDAIREKTNDTGAIAVPDIPDKINDVYEAGKKEEYDDYWETIQNHDQPSELYTGAFGAWMTAEKFKPKYKTFKVRTRGDMMFIRCAFDGEPLDLSGITITFENMSWLSRFIMNAHMKNVYLDFSSVKNLELIIEASGGAYNKIDDVTMKITESTESISYLVRNASSMKNLTCTADSVIACNGIDFSTDTSLTRESLVSFLNALKNYSGVSGTTYKITLGSTNLAKLTTADKNIATQKGWVLA